jgi:hypothetical protein
MVSPQFHSRAGQERSDKFSVGGLLNLELLARLAYSAKQLKLQLYWTLEPVTTEITPHANHSKPR